MNTRLRMAMTGALLCAATAAWSAGGVVAAGDTNGRDPALREAAAAKQEARQGILARGDNPAEFEHNRLARCDEHTGEDRDLCIRRMNGEGTVSGSVEGGGILRELRVQVPAGKQ
jgi:hypothetical protein